MAIELNRNLGLRVVSGLSALPIVLWPVTEGGIWLLLLAILASVVMAVEWLKLVNIYRFSLVLVITVLVVASLAIYQGILSGEGPSGIVLESSDHALAVGITSVVVLCGFVLRPTSSVFFRFLIGLAYILTLLLGILYLRSQDNGALLVVWLLFTVWATDVGGYFAGKGIGGPKLAPIISPKKTWAGLIGGVLLASAIGALITVLSGWWSPGLAAVFSAVMAVISQIGDLYESRLKRLFDIKDSGGIMPGHGGILDRVDGLVFAAGAAAILMALAHPGS